MLDFPIPFMPINEICRKVRGIWARFSKGVTGV